MFAVHYLPILYFFCIICLVLHLSIREDRWLKNQMYQTTNFSPLVPSEPRWLNEARACRYVSAVGIELGRVQLGEGTARSIWFGYVGKDTTPITPGGRTDREEAKSDVVRMVEIDVGLMATQQEYLDEQRRKR